MLIKNLQIYQKKKKSTKLKIKTKFIINEFNKIIKVNEFYLNNKIINFNKINNFYINNDIIIVNLKLLIILIL